MTAHPKCWTRLWVLGVLGLVSLQLWRGKDMRENILTLTLNRSTRYRGLRGKFNALCTWREFFGASAKWSSPDGGLYIWMELDEKIDVQGLNEKALDPKFMLDFNPGTNYSPDGKSGKKLY
ncbi:MAG: hypothetical protein CM1200mP3_00080 [Chloroflexota bacterium]|nr:MAG: hypothetical protein CM1200mP3_00080 [Chloroflexota bacterium]